MGLTNPRLIEQHSNPLNDGVTYSTPCGENNSLCVPPPPLPHFTPHHPPLYTERPRGWVVSQTYLSLSSPSPTSANGWGRNGNTSREFWGGGGRFVSDSQHSPAFLAFFFKWTQFIYTDIAVGTLRETLLLALVVQIIKHSTLVGIQYVYYQSSLISKKKISIESNPYQG